MEHAHYYQVQVQMHVCDADFCDFVVCLFPHNAPSIFVKRVYRDTALWDYCVEKANEFFRVCVLPELMGRAYTRPQSA